jgi:hypothetical protein
MIVRLAPHGTVGGQAAVSITTDIRTTQAVR